MGYECIRLYEIIKAWDSFSLQDAGELDLHMMVESTCYSLHQAGVATVLPELWEVFWLREAQESQGAPHNRDGAAARWPFMWWVSVMISPMIYNHKAHLVRRQ